MEIPEQVWLLIARNLSGEASEQEKNDLAELLREDEQLQQHYDLLTRIWIEKQVSQQNEDSVSAKNIVSRIITKAENDFDNNQVVPMPVFKANGGMRRTWIGAAAAGLMIVFAGWLWLGNRTSGEREKKQAVIEAQNGSRSRSVLPDGSTVWLNAGSKLYYDNDFTGTTREVRLEGEAFFDVVKKTDQPFIVHTSGIDVKVMGTAFNVKSYPEDKTVETILYRGLVQVFRHEETEKKAIHLRPNQKVTLFKEAAIMQENLSDLKALSPAKAIPASPTYSHIDSTKKENERIETAWVYDRLEFRGDNFEEVAGKLERWYNVKIHFTDEKVKLLTVKGSFTTETVEQAFLALKVGFPITYIINKNKNNHEVFVGSAN